MTASENNRIRFMNAIEMASDEDVIEFFRLFDLDDARNPYSVLHNGVYIMDCWVLWNKAIQAMKRVVIVVSGGVADYHADYGVNVLLIDTDDLDDECGVNVCGDKPTLEADEIVGFEHLIPEWIINDYITKPIPRDTMIEQIAERNTVFCSYIEMREFYRINQVDFLESLSDAELRKMS